MHIDFAHCTYIHIYLLAAISNWLWLLVLTLSFRERFSYSSVFYFFSSSPFGLSSFTFNLLDLCDYCYYLLFDGETGKKPCFVLFNLCLRVFCFVVFMHFFFFFSCAHVFVPSLIHCHISQLILRLWTLEDRKYWIVKNYYIAEGGKNGKIKF